MEPEVEAFVAKQAEKAEHKAAVMTALGAAKLAEHEGRDASPFWDTVTARGVAGEEGRCQAELQAMADAYVSEHPEQVANLTSYTTWEKHDELVTMISILRDGGFIEQATLATMWELARFERQHIGSQTHVTVRVRPGRSA